MLESKQEELWRTVPLPQEQKEYKVYARQKALSLCQLDGYSVRTQATSRVEGLLITAEIQDKAQKT